MTPTISAITVMPAIHAVVTIRLTRWSDAACC